MLRNGYEARVDLAIGASPQDMSPYTDCTRRLLDIAQLASSRWPVRVQQDPERRRLRHQFTQQPETLGFQRGSQDIDPGRISAWLAVARHESQLDRVGADLKDDRNSRCCGLRRLGRRVATHR